VLCSHRRQVVGVFVPFRAPFTGDRHEFNELKPKIENLVALQRQLANGFYLKQKNYLKKEKTKEAESCFKSMKLT
jgi:hypothetical protein